MALIRKFANPSATTWTTLYTTGAAEEIAVSSFTVSNTSTTGAADVSIYVRPTSDAVRGIQHAVLTVIGLQAVSTANMHRASVVEGTAVPPNHIVEVYASNALCAFAMNGDTATV